MSKRPFHGVNMVSHFSDFHIPLHDTTNISDLLHFRKIQEGLENILQGFMIRKDYRKGPITTQ